MYCSWHNIVVLTDEHCPLAARSKGVRVHVQQLQHNPVAVTTTAAAHLTHLSVCQCWPLS